MLTAALVCIPASPNIDAIKSDAPLITLGCSVKSSVEFTNPVNFTHDFTFDKSLSQVFLTCATIPEEKDPTELTMEEALILIEKRKEYDKTKKSKKRKSK